MNLILDRIFIFIFLTCFSRLLFDGLSNMVMSFCGIVLFLITLLMALNFFLKYVGISFMVMFLHQYHAYHDYMIHRNYWLRKNKSKAFDPSC